MSKTEETESRLALDAEIDQTEGPLTERKNRWIFSLAILGDQSYGLSQFYIYKGGLQVILIKFWVLYYCTRMKSIIYKDALS